MNFTKEEYNILIDILHEAKSLDPIQKQKFIKDLEADIDEEISKPDCNIELVNNYVDYLGKLKGIQFDDVRLSTAQASVIRTTKKGMIGANIRNLLFGNKLSRTLTIGAFSVLLFLSCNFIIADATGINLFSDFIQYSKDHIVFNFSSKELVTSEGDGSIHAQLEQKCAAVGLDAHLPTSYPEDASILSFKTSPLGTTGQLISFTVGNKSRNITVHIETYATKSEIPDLHIPDTTGAEKIQDAGHDYYVSKTNDYYNIMFVDENCVYNISSFFPYDTTVKIIESIKW
jgi:hypothetical protein